MDIATFIIGKETTDEEVEKAMENFRAILATGKDVAFVIRKGALTDAPKVEYKNENTMIREEIIQHIVKASGEDPIVSTTGKASRELFETRAANGQSHKYDFLTVGSMGHSSSIALGVAINKPEQQIWCIDGDGAVLMHMGAMAVMGANKPKNLIHVVINNAAHETVGGMPTVAGQIDLVAIAKACGYPNAVRVDTSKSLIDHYFNDKDTSGFDPHGVCKELIFALRKALDDEGFNYVKIIVSSSFTAQKIAEWVELGVPVNTYGVGTALVNNTTVGFTGDLVMLDGEKQAKEGRENIPSARLKKVPYPIY